MGIRPGSLYAAFGDKKSLFKQVVEAYGHSPEGAFIAQALAEEPTAHAVFTRILHEATTIYPDPSHPADCLTITAATNITRRTASTSTQGTTPLQLRCPPEHLAGYSTYRDQQGELRISMNLEHLQAQLNDLAIEIKRWDEHRQHISHKEDNEGGAYTEWHDSDDWAVEIVRSIQQILGDSAIATPTTSSIAHTASRPVWQRPL